MLHRIRYWIRAIVRRSALDRELQEEMQLHLDRRTEALIKEGLSPDDARLTARREFGNPTAHQRRREGRNQHRLARFDPRRRPFRAPLLRAQTALRRDDRPRSRTRHRRKLVPAVGAALAHRATARRNLRRPVPLVRLRGMYRAKDAPRWQRPHALVLRGSRDLGSPEYVRGCRRLDDEQSRRERARHNGGDATLWAQFVTQDFFKVIGARVTKDLDFPTPTTERNPPA